MASSADPFLFASSDREPTSAELKTEITEIEEEWARLGESWDSLEQAAVAKWQDDVPPSTLAALSLHGIVAPSRSKQVTPGPAAPSAGLRTKMSLGRKPSVTALREPPPSSSIPRPPASTPLAGLSDDAKGAIQSFAKELEEIRARRRATEEKYGKRLEFLRSRLRGALLRERLPR